VRRITLQVLLMAVFALPALPLRADNDLEESVCNRMLEPLLFWLWQRSAGTARIDPARMPAGVEALSHQTRDGRKLSGFRLRARVAPGSDARGFLLVAQGNATLAERLIGRLRDYADAGYDVFIFDYRGYGRSEGQRRLKAIAADYRDILASLSQSQSGERLLYGMSFGGIVLLHAIRKGQPFDRAVIDSTPARVSTYGCPRRYDPVTSLPGDSRGMLLISGAQDRVVPPEDSAPLLDAGEARGARVVRSADFDHPFMDRDPAVREARQALIHSFLTGIRQEQRSGE